MEALLGALEQSSLALYLRNARWGYALVNASHILGIALLIGSIVPLNLRLLGVWRSVAQRDLVRVFAPMAAFGLVLAACTGIALFSVRANEYAALPVLWIKLLLIATGAISAVSASIRFGVWLDKGEVRKGVALVSLGCWLGALLAGRLIAFFD